MLQRTEPSRERALGGREKAPSAKRLVAEARAEVRHVAAEQLREVLDQGAIVLVDVREQAEREVHGVIAGSLHVPRGMLEFCADPELPVHATQLEPSRPIVLYCASGNRSALAARTLTAMGFADVADLDGGFESWRQSGGAVAPAPPAATAPWARLLRP